LLQTGSGGNSSSATFLPFFFFFPPSGSLAAASAASAFLSFLDLAVALGYGIPSMTFAMLRIEASLLSKSSSKAQLLLMLLPNLRVEPDWRTSLLGYNFLRRSSSGMLASAALCNNFLGWNVTPGSSELLKGLSTRLTGIEMIQITEILCQRNSQPELGNLHSFLGGVLRHLSSIGL
jgi:hypothetical protein